MVDVFDSDSQVKFPSLSADADVSGPSADVDADLDVDASLKAPSGGVSGDVDLDLPELKAADVNLPSADLEGSSPELDVDVSAPDVKVKGKGKGGFKMPKFGFGGKGDAKGEFV